jgi:hypothetical protein
MTSRRAGDLVDRVPGCEKPEALGKNDESQKTKENAKANQTGKLVQDNLPLSIR